MFCINHKEGRGPHKCLNLGPQLPCYATGSLSYTLNEWPYPAPRSVSGVGNVLRKDVAAVMLRNKRSSWLGPSYWRFIDYIWATLSMWAAIPIGPTLA